MGGDEGDLAMVVNKLCSESKEGCEVAHARAWEKSYMRMRMQKIITS